MRTQQRKAWTAPRRIHDDRRVSSPANLGHILVIHKIDFGGEGVTAIGDHAEQTRQQRNIARRKRMRTGAENVQRLPLANENDFLALLHDHLRSHAEVAVTALWFAVDKLIIHDI